MNNYPQSEYPDLYQEILEDYYFRFPKYHSIPYPLLRKDLKQNETNSKRFTGTI